MMDIKKKQLRIIIAITAVIIVGAIIYAVYPRTQLLIQSAPKSVDIKIDNSAVKHVNRGDKVSVSKGNHTIVVSQDDFSSYTTNITVKFGETKEFLVALDPQTDAARELISDQTSQDIIQRFYGNKLSNQTDQLNKDYPILKVLPINARLYRVYPCASQKYPNDATKIAICVDTSQDGLEPYIAKDFASRGYDINNYEVIYSDPDAD